MGKRTSYDPGTFCWAGLATSDPAGAKAFYASLFGWEVEDLSGGEAGPYTMLRRDGEDVAILYEQMEAARAAQARPHWTSFLSVEDADATAAKAGEIGGSTVGERFEITEAGGVAAIRDPAGAIVSVWQPRSMIGATLVNDVHALCWNELATPDPERAVEFYSALFGWAFETVPTPEGVPEIRTILNSKGWRNGSTRKLEGEHAAIPAHWTPYFGAESTADLVGRVGELGGHVVFGPIEVPAGQMAIVADPQGATFGIVEGDMDP